MATEKVQHEYGADEIQILEGLEAVRKRPGMYIGSTSSRGLHHLVYEIVDNAVDEALAGFCDTIHVTINPDNSVTVTDNGRGIPVGINHKSGLPAVEVVFTVLHAGGKFGGGGYKVSGGLHGVGASVVNALSVWLEVEICHEGKVYRQRYERGKVAKKLEVIGECEPGKTGTKVTFLPDGEIFETTIFDYSILQQRFREMAFLTKGLKIGDIDARAKQEHCRTISDKARAIGGGVLDAVCSYEKSRGKYALILLAAGQSVRFGSDKLKVVVEGEAMYESAISRFEAFQGFKSYVVTGKEEITLSAESAGCTVVCNKEPEKGISLSVKLGLTKAIEDAEGNGTPLRGVLFSVCDQPRLKKSTIQRIINTAFHNPGKIVCAGEGTRNGNPVLWDKRFFDKLLELDGDIGGKKILKENLDSLKIVPVQAGELQDIDRKEDLGTA